MQSEPYMIILPQTKPSCQGSSWWPQSVTRLSAG